jgi:NAD(P)H-hydrate epimerase|tara:strand:+ start:427 stop:1884 length:1458 start_codon:yes stop_codon:yes gene_type:complete
MDVYLASECRELDRIAIEEEGIEGFELMRRAGQAAFNELARRWPDAGSVSVVCGKGNNAGDGYVIAGLARESGFDVQLLQLDVGVLSGDAALAVEFAARRGVTAQPGDGELRGDVIVDALLGTGLSGELREPYRSAVQRINAVGCGVLAVDIPTGVLADTGMVLDPAVRADVTVSFIGRKVGLHTGPGLDCCGEVVHDTLGVSDAVFDALPGCPLLRWSGDLLPVRPINAYKQGVGHLVIAGGDYAMSGAVLLAGEAALRAGVGLVSILTHQEHAAGIVSRRPELMVRNASDEQVVRGLLGAASAVVLGPGLGRSSWAGALYRRVVAANKPTLIDADGLRIAVEDGRPVLDEVLITPHAGEAGALLGCGNAEINEDRLDSARRLGERVGGVAVLKGAGSVIADAQNVVGIVAHGNPGMASAGMGDVLSGIAGGFLAQGLSLKAAAVAGATLHSAAGDAAARCVGQRSLLASDVTDAMIELLKGSG